MLSAKIVKDATLKVYPGAPHGLPSTLKDQVNADLLAFFKEPARDRDGVTGARSEMIAQDQLRKGRSPWSG